MHQEDTIPAEETPIAEKRSVFPLGYRVAAVVLAVLALDQALKIYIKTHFCYNEDVLLFGQDWARLHFVENEGMAFGITFDWPYGKLLLSLFRILMVAGLIWYIKLLMRAKAPNGFVYSVGLITAGAIGNIIDSAIYGVIFSASSFHDCIPAQFVPWGEGYGEFLHGKVVDMLYFPMHYFEMPEWLGGGSFLFFSPIFNIADASITCGVILILLFQRSFFKSEIQGQAEEAVLHTAEKNIEEIELPMMEEAVTNAVEAPEEQPADDEPAPEKPTEADEKGS